MSTQDLSELYPVLTLLPAALAERMLGQAQTITVPGGTVVFDEHQVCQGFPFVISASSSRPPTAASCRFTA